MDTVLDIKQRQHLAYLSKSVSNSNNESEHQWAHTVKLAFLKSAGQGAVNQVRLSGN